MKSFVKFFKISAICMLVFSIIVMRTEANSEDQKVDKTLSPYFLIKSDDAEIDQLPLLLTSAEVNITGVIADVTLTQVYKNEGTQPLEAIYVFPGSTRAALYGMTMTIGSRTIFAQVQERQHARKNYEQAKRQGKTASLLEQQRPNVFQMNVANILPGDRIKVELQYTELLLATDGMYEFVYPTVVGPRYSNKQTSSAVRSETWVSNPYIELGQGEHKKEDAPYLFDIRINLSTGIPIQEISCDSHDVDIDYEGPASATITLDEAIITEKIKGMRADHLQRLKMVLKDLYIGEDFASLPVFYKKLFHIGQDYYVNVQHAEIIDERVKTVKEFSGDRDYILRYRLAGGKIESGLLLYEGQEENFFLLMMQPPKQIAVEDIPPREYIFIIDISGSMRGFPLETSKILLRNLVSGIRPTDTFNVLLFAGSSNIMSDHSLPASTQNIKQAIDLIDQQRGGGRTELLPALKRALALPKIQGAARTIVLATDGYIDVETEAFDLIRNNLHNSNIFTFGIGKSVNRFLLEGLARVGLGEPFVITKADKAAGNAEKFRQYISSPVLTGITSHFDSFDAYDIEPASIPDVLAERPIILFGKWRGQSAGTITLHGFSGQGEYQQTFYVSGISSQENHSALRYLWARKRIEILGDYNKLQKHDSRIQEITQLGLRYNLLTAYTSFVAIDEKIRRQEDQLKTVKQPLPLPQGVSKSAIARVRKAPEPELSFLMLIGAVLAIFALRKKV